MYPPIVQFPSADTYKLHTRIYCICPVYLPSVIGGGGGWVGVGVRELFEVMYVVCSDPILYVYMWPKGTLHTAQVNTLKSDRNTSIQKNYTYSSS
jgi:hypothetical protein